MLLPVMQSHVCHARGSGREGGTPFPSHWTRLKKCPPTHHAFLCEAQAQWSLSRIVLELGSMEFELNGKLGIWRVAFCSPCGTSSMEFELSSMEFELDCAKEFASRKRDKGRTFLNSTQPILPLRERRKKDWHRLERGLRCAGLQ